MQCHVHPRYIRQLMAGPAALLLLILFVLNFTQIYQNAQSILPWLFSFEILLLDVLFTIAILVPSYAWIWLKYRNFVYILKKNELVIRKGIIRRRNNAVPYDKIRNVQRTQSILERVFGLCTVSIETSNISLDFPDTAIHGVLNSRELPELILGKMHASQNVETDRGNTAHNVLSQPEDLNKREEDRGR